MELIRLDRYLSEIPAGTRSQVKDMIRSGRVAVNGSIVRKPETKIDAESDEVFLDRHLVTLDRRVWYMLNKPAGVLSAGRDKKQKTVLDLIEGGRKDLFPVGRLDKDTTGLLLITNDGDLAHRLLSPKRHCDKVYAVGTDFDIAGDAGERFAEGLDLGDFTSMPADWQQLSPRSGLLTIREGKYHQVKRMFEALGLKVTALHRVSFGGITLDPDLAPGQSRRLTEGEIAVLEQAAGLPSSPKE